MRMPSSPLGHHFYTMACNNAWANHRLLNACARLSSADFIAPRTSFFPSIKATLNHIVTVDWYYVDALERALRGDAPNTDVNAFSIPRNPSITAPNYSKPSGGGSPAHRAVSGIDRCATRPADSGSATCRH
jgi:hypothetical protein